MSKFSPGMVDLLLSGPYLVFSSRVHTLDMQRYTTYSNIPASD